MRENILMVSVTKLLIIQPTKERKYGLIVGTYLRWSMNVDVFPAYLREIIETYT